MTAGGASWASGVGGDGLSDAVLLARCRERLRGVFPKPPTSVEQLREAAQEVLGRPVRFIVGNPGAERQVPASALWFQLNNDVDVVWVDDLTSRWYRVVLACHEFGHIFSRHTPALFDNPAARATAVQDLMSDEEAARAGVTAAMITSMMQRCGQPTIPGSADWAIEREAEIAGRFLAQRLLERLGRGHPLGL